MQLWLEVECYKLLLDQVPRGSPAYDVLINATRVYNHGLLPDSYCVICSPEDTRRYLHTAIRHFPDWVGSLVLAMITARQRW